MSGWVLGGAGRTPERELLANLLAVIPEIHGEPAAGAALVALVCNGLSGRYLLLTYDR